MLRYDHYKLLGIARDASLAQIKRAYRERVKNCHPDINPSPRAATAFRAVHEAYSVLSNTRERSIYDDRLQYYRQHTPPAAVDQQDVKRYGHTRRRPVEHHDVPETPAGPVDKFAFFGLHLVGLFFGIALVSGILAGITFQNWPVMTLIFCAFGLAIIPDSWEGLRTKASHSAH